MGLLPVVHLVRALFGFYYLLLLARVILSWIPFHVRHPIISAIGPPVYAVTEPLLAPIRRMIRRHVNTGPIDFSPIVLYLALQVLESVTLGIVSRILGLAPR